jgi:hypothetical protein
MTQSHKQRRNLVGPANSGEPLADVWSVVI